MGYARFDNEALVALMNDLYKNEASQMNNFFLPNFKLRPFNHEVQHCL
jgi:hypothetical protein